MLCHGESVVALDCRVCVRLEHDADDFRFNLVNHNNHGVDVSKYEK